MLPNDPRKEIFDPARMDMPDEKQLTETIQIAKIYEETQRMPGWQHYRDSILSRIEVLDAKADSLGDNNFNEFRAIRIEMKVLHNSLRLFQERINAGERARKLLEQQRRK